MNVLISETKHKPPQAFALSAAMQGVAISIFYSVIARLAVRQGVAIPSYGEKTTVIASLAARQGVAISHYGEKS